jgi:hypothetical protein
LPCLFFINIDYFVNAPAAAPSPAPTAAPTAAPAAGLPAVKPPTTAPPTAPMPAPLKTRCCVGVIVEQLLNVTTQNTKAIPFITDFFKLIDNVLDIKPPFYIHLLFYTFINYYQVCIL